MVKAPRELPYAGACQKFVVLRSGYFPGRTVRNPSSSEVDEIKHSEYRHFANHIITETMFRLHRAYRTPKLPFLYCWLQGAVGPLLF
jgi:hypothetical protein